jgi:3-deoxy-manno-octulosonate cytidylyltransferase (CMP-KDO synthetase)
MRLPRKPLRLLGGVPLVVRVWERVMASAVADHCLVATESPEVVSAARAHGADVVLTSDRHLSGTDRVAEAVAGPAYKGFDIILNVQGDEPFVSAAALRAAMAFVADARFELGTAAVRAPQDVLAQPHVVKVVADNTGRAMYFSRAGIPFLREGGDAALLNGMVWQHLGVYAYSRRALSQWVALPPHPLEQIERLEQLRPLAAGMAMGVALIDEPVRGGIDTEDELAQANSDWSTFLTGQR